MLEPFILASIPSQHRESEYHARRIPLDSAAVEKALIWCESHVGYNFTRLSRSAFMTTVKDDNAIAAPANIGDIRMPETG